MLTIGVLGANGFVGSRLLEIFHLNREFRIIPIAHSFSGLARCARFNLEWRIAEATDIEGLTKAFYGCDVIVHSIAGSLEAITKSPSATLKAAKSARVRRVIYLSTASVHGQDPLPGTNEASPLHTNHPVPYNNAKVVAEKEFLARHKSMGIELIVLRPGIVFGPRDAWITGIGRQLVNGNAYLVEGGRGYCNTIYVDNLIHAVRRSVTAEVDGEVFLVGDSETITWHELYVRVATALGYTDEIRSLPAPQSFESHSNLVDSLKTLPGLQTILDYVPKQPKAFGRKQLEILNDVKHGILHALQKEERNPWARRKQSSPAVSEETALLHQCRYHLDYEKAKRMLEYVPPVSLEEGLRRSIGWLEFIGLSNQMNLYPAQLVLY